MISKAGYVLHVHDGWNPLTEQEEVVEIQRVVAVNDENLMVEEQDFDPDQVWNVTPLATEGQYRFTSVNVHSYRHLTTDNSDLSIYILGITLLFGHISSP